MNATQQLSPLQTASPAHPLILVAAGSVIVLSLAGVATLAGWLPGSGNTGTHAAPVIDPAKMVTAPISIQQTVTVPQAKPETRPVDRTIERPVASVRRNVPSTVTPAANTPARITVSSASTFPASPTASPAPAICRDCGSIEAVHVVNVEAKASGAGAVAGGLVGAIIGHQIGNGSARDVARVLGAVGGAFAGNQIEKSSKESKRYDVVVRFEDGTSRTFSNDTPPGWQSGDRVRVQNGVLIPRGGMSGSV